jgi:hypothetical protein
MIRPKLWDLFEFGPGKHSRILLDLDPTQTARFFWIFRIRPKLSDSLVFRSVETVGFFRIWIRPKLPDSFSFGIRTNCQILSYSDPSKLSRDSFGSGPNCRDFFGFGSGPKLPDSFGFGRITALYVMNWYVRRLKLHIPVLKNLIFI